MIYTIPLLVVMLCTIDDLSIGTFTFDFDKRVSGKSACVYTPSKAKSFTICHWAMLAVDIESTDVKYGLNFFVSEFQAVSTSTKSVYCLLSSFRLYTFRQNLLRSEE